MSEIDILKAFIDEVNRIDFGTIIKFSKVGEVTTIEISKNGEVKKTECCKAIAKEEFTETKRREIKPVEKEEAKTTEEVEQIVDEIIDEILEEEKVEISEPVKEQEEEVPSYEDEDEEDDEDGSDEDEDGTDEDEEGEEPEPETGPETEPEQENQEDEESEDCPALGEGFSPDTEECMFCQKEFTKDFMKCKKLFLASKERPKVKPVKVKKKVLPSREKSRFGHGLDKIGGVIDTFLCEGTQYGVMIDEISKRFNVSAGQVRSLVNGHYKHLMKKHRVTIANLNTISAKTPYTEFLKIVK